MALPTPINPYFLVKIDKVKQQEKGQRVGRFYLPPSETMENNLQCGEVVSISEKASKIFPEAKVGDLLILHHMVESMTLADSKEDHWVDEDDDYNYYVVTPIPHNGKGNEVYGLWDGEKIVMHPDFLLLEPEAVINGAKDVETFIEEAVEKSTGGLFIFKEWRESREEKTARLTERRLEVQRLGEKNELTPELQADIARREEEMTQISNEINEIAYKPYKIAACHPIVSEWFDRKVGAGDTIYCQSRAAQTKIEFMGKEYRSCPVAFIGYMLN